MMILHVNDRSQTKGVSRDLVKDRANMEVNFKSHPKHASMLNGCKAKYDGDYDI